MRPRVFPAEDVGHEPLHRRIVGVASMRPRVFPAEDSAETPVRMEVNGASMRPRVFPAEDGRRGPGLGAPAVRFNEAAGIPRGRHLLEEKPHGCKSRASMRPRVFPAEDAAGSAVQGRVVGASMRPRVFPAEDQSMQPIAFHSEHRFNEAAGIPRGRQGRYRWLSTPTESFNEAAGIPRGRRGRRDIRLPVQIALQ